MPKSDPSLMDSLLLPTRPAAPPHKRNIRLNPDLEAAHEACWNPAEWAFNRADPDREPAELDPQERDRSARAQALVSPPLGKLSAPSEMACVDVTFTENDPRACPRNLDELKLSIALELDRLRDNKKMYD